MNYILDVVACGGIVFIEIFGIFLAMIFIQGFVYQVSGKRVNPWKSLKKWAKKEIYGSGKHMYISGK